MSAVSRNDTYGDKTENNIRKESREGNRKKKKKKQEKTRKNTKLNRIDCRQGKPNQVVDALSRLPGPSLLRGKLSYSSVSLILSTKASQFVLSSSPLYDLSAVSFFCALNVAVTEIGRGNVALCFGQACPS